MMKQRPILFSTPMVQAILAGNKTQTRRIVKPQLPYSPSVEKTIAYYKNEYWYYTNQNKTVGESIGKCPYGEPGDVLWVRETLYQVGELGLEYEANKETIDNNIIPENYGPYGGDYSFRKIPNIHMPYWAARIFLQITDIRVERLQDISEADADAEGIRFDYEADKYYNYLTDRFELLRAPGSYFSLWDKINGEGAFMQNPWVWVVTFNRIEKP